MALMTDDTFVRLVQRRLAESGHYTGAIDGMAGDGTRAALDKALPPLTVISVLPSEEEALPKKSEGKLVGVHETLASIVREAFARLGGGFIVIEGLRTKERQAQMVKQGSSKTMNSRHLTGHAVDLWPLDANGNALTSGTSAKEAALWASLRTIMGVVRIVAKERGVAINLGVDWGWDAPHVELNRAAYPA